MASIPLRKFQDFCKGCKTEKGFYSLLVKAGICLIFESGKTEFPAGLAACCRQVGRQTCSLPLLVGCSKRIARPDEDCVAWIITLKWGLFIMPMTFHTSLHVQAFATVQDSTATCGDQDQNKHCDVMSPVNWHGSSKHLFRPHLRLPTDLHSNPARSTPKLQLEADTHSLHVAANKQAVHPPLGLRVVGCVHGSAAQLGRPQDVDGGHLELPQHPAPVLAVHVGLLLAVELGQAPGLAAVKGELAPDHLAAPTCRASSPVSSSQAMEACDEAHQIWHHAIQAAGAWQAVRSDRGVADVCRPLMAGLNVCKSGLQIVFQAVQVAVQAGSSLQVPKANGQDVLTQSAAALRSTLISAACKWQLCMGVLGCRNAYLCRHSREQCTPSR